MYTAMKADERMFKSSEAQVPIRNVETVSTCWKIHPSAAVRTRRLWKKKNTLQVI